MKKISGILMLLIYVCVATTMLNGAFVSSYNMQNIARWSSLFGIIGIGVAFVIITGGIDLSIGSVIGLVGCLLPMLLTHYQWSVPAAVAAGMGLSLVIGVTHGLLITKMKLQPFVVTLCGLLFYRGLARWITGDQTQGFGTGYDEGLRLIATGKPCSVPQVLLVVGIGLAVFSVWQVIAAARNSTEHRLGLAIFGLVAGLVLAVVGGSAASDGLASVLSTMHINAPKSKLPTVLMGVVGWLAIPFSLWFLVHALVKNPKTTWPPLVGVVVSSLLLVMAMEIVRQPDDWYRWGPTWATRWRMMVIFPTLGAFMGTIAWLGRNALQYGGEAIRLPLIAAASTAILWLASHTSLGETLVPAPFFVVLIIGAIAAAFLNLTIYGRYLLALGRNEQAARFSGIKTDRLVVLAYVICSVTAGIGGVLFALDGNSVQPSGQGNFYELYAIAAAVLGGCSLRGGEGTILGVVIGAAVMRVLYNSINLLGIPSQMEFAIIGIVILIGALVDELVKKLAARRRAAQRASGE